MVQKKLDKDTTKRETDTIRTVNLPKPEIKRGRALASALELRMTTREISSRKLPLQTLSNLLWAACGVNRRKGPFGIQGRTAASASNSQEIDVYVALQAGSYRYDPIRHQLEPVADCDLRRFAIGQGQNAAGAEAPVRLIYVADIDKLEHTSGFDEPGLHNPEIQRAYYYVDTGMIAANVYLFAATSGLAAWFHNCDKAQLPGLLNLRKDQRVLFGQTIGYPMKKQHRSSL
jgi:SagB-type dehydrogenase family enzyme